MIEKNDVRLQKEFHLLHRVVGAEQNIQRAIRYPRDVLVRLALKASLTAGQYFDGTIMTFGPAELTMRPSSSMKFSVDYQYSQIDVQAREQYFKTH